MKNQDKPIHPLRGADGTIFKNDGYADQVDLLSGLTKREEFARSAMQAILSNTDGSHTPTTFILEYLELPTSTTYQFAEHYPKYIAKLAILYADELLKQLES